MRIAIIVLSLFSVSFAMAYFSVLKRLEVITKAFAQLVVLNSTIQEAFEANIQSPVSKEDQDIHKENFIKFLSDSRDWAFEYIEEYGLVGDAYPHYHSMKKISAAYKDLKKLLPEEVDDRR
jgi:hypothetical protein